MKKQVNNAQTSAKANNAKKQVINNECANNAKKSAYIGMYAEIKAAAQTPSAVVKSFYNAALSIDGGAYADLYKRIFGDTKNDFCNEWTPRVVDAFQKQSRCKRVSLFFVWNVVYKGGLGEYLKNAKKIAAATAKADAKTQKALQALESLGEAAKAAK